MRRLLGCVSVFTVMFVLDQYILRDLEKKKILVFTPSRRVGGKRVVCYDDRFIVKLAHESDGIVVSNDTYRDLQNERPEWKKFIEERLLMYSFVNDKYVPVLPLLLQEVRVSRLSCFNEAIASVA